MLLRILLLSLVFIGLSAVVEAQTFPLNVHAEWTPNPAAEGVTSYLVSFNGLPSVSVDPVTCTATLCKSPDHVVTATGPQSATVIAVNQWAQSLPATVSVTVAAPGRSGNVQIKR